MDGTIRKTWARREFVWSSIQNELAARFARSRIGTVWLLIHPLANVAILACVLSAVLSAKLPMIEGRFAYALYLMAGMLGWSLFVDVITRQLTVFVDHGNLLKKVAFPPLQLVVIATGGAIVHNVFLLVAVAVSFLLMGHALQLTVLWLPLLIALNLALAAGVGLVLGVLNVFIRDVGQAVPTVLQLSFWLTPVAYTADMLPEAYRPLLHINPMAPLIHAYQQILVLNEAPDWAPLSFTACVASVAIGLGAIVLRRAAPEIVDLL